MLGEREGSRCALVTPGSETEMAGLDGSLRERDCRRSKESQTRPTWVTLAGSCGGPGSAGIGPACHHSWRGPLRWNRLSP
jgi:hypothetical protein